MSASASNQPEKAKEEEEEEELEVYRDSFLAEGIKVPSR